MWRRLHYDKRNVQKSLEQYRTLREANLALLKTLTPEQWKHYGMHSSFLSLAGATACILTGSRPSR